ncbi:hypothetical protein KM043_008312 [Ampulex compressa]|nr:hypothetical protein KM043_008312 [Ampulex compressa]
MTSQDTSRGVRACERDRISEGPPDKRRLSDQPLRIQRARRRKPDLFPIQERLSSRLEISVNAQKERRAGIFLLDSSEKKRGHHRGGLSLGRAELRRSLTLRARTTAIRPVPIRPENEIQK